MFSECFLKEFFLKKYKLFILTESLTSEQRCDSVVRSQLLIKKYTQVLLTQMIDHSATQWQMDLLRGLALGNILSLVNNSSFQILSFHFQR